MAKRAATKIASSGICTFCNQEFDKSRMTVHLKACKQRASPNAARMANAPEEEKTTLYHIVVEGQYRPQYWMHLEMPDRATLRDLDDFLRYTWVECCDHLSEFTFGKDHYLSHLEDEDEEELDEELPEEMSDEDVDSQIADLIAKNELRPELAPLLKSLVTYDGPQEYGMGVTLGKVLSPGKKFTYVYDFGSSTTLSLKVADERESVVGEEEDDVKILSRNIAPVYPCDMCKQPADFVVTYYEEWDNHDFLCKACVKKLLNEQGEEVDEEYEDEYYDGLLPVVNSPRMGVCGYTGEADYIDEEDEFEEDGEGEEEE